MFDNVTLKLSAVLSPHNNTFMSPVTTARSSPLVTLSPSFTFKSTTVFSSRSVNTLANIGSPHMIPSCLHISCTSPFLGSGITLLVDTSSLVISSFNALIINGSAFNFKVKDGDKVTKGELLAVVTGDIKVLLCGERTALNYLQRMSGIATYTNEVAQCLEGTGIKLLDTRKTTPNNRLFEKYAVRVGGGNNHRYNLTDGVLLKDNHIGAAGGVAKAVKMAKEYAPFVRKIEIEVENLDMVREAVEAGADIIMLDNMSHDTMKEALNIIDGRAEVEISGNITKENLEKLSGLSVDYVSSGALTHSAPIMDISLKNLHPIE